MEGYVDPQTAFNIVIALAGTFGGWMLKMIYDAIRDLREEDSLTRAKVDELVTSLPNTYIRRDDAKDMFNGLQQSISDLRTEVRSGLERVFDRIDGKQDKPT